MQYYLAIDIGASSGRHIVGWMEDGVLQTKEVYRFPNGVVEENGHLIWDIRKLLSSVVTGISKAFEEFSQIESLSIDTWGVDYVLLKGNEEVLPVYAYRDSRTEAVIPHVHEKMSFSELYRHTRCQFQPFNSIYQIYDDEIHGQLDGVTDLLMIPEYLMWKLCGIKAREYTNATTISYLLDTDEVAQYLDLNDVKRTIPLGFDATAISSKIFIVTGTGKYFKNVDTDPETNLGIVRIAQDGHTAELLWGYKDGGKFTSEFPAHLMSHMARLSVDPENRVVMHCHPTYTLAMNYVHELDEKKFTHSLWEMCTECIVVFPDGVGVLPWMLCGTNTIGQATAEKMKEFRLVVWGMHGIYGAGKTIDETFGLIETVEKAAQIYMLTAHLPRVNTIRDDQMVELAEYFGVKYDCIICPEYQVLSYSTTNRDGYREYKSDPKICANCPTRHLCTKSKDCVKTVTRHIWKEYEEMADDARYTPIYQRMYKARKETIERVFADAKEKHGMRYTRYTGLAQVTDWVKLTFAAMNLKKFAKWRWKDTHPNCFSCVISVIFPQYA